MKIKLRPIFAFSAMVLFSACSVFGIRTTPEPDYEVIEEQGKIQIRVYPALLLASVQLNGNYEETSDAAFRQLFQYISGENESSQKIEMTAPVFQSPESEIGSQEIQMTAPVFVEQNANQWLMSFVLPNKFSMETVPKPKNENVVISFSSPKKYAVLRYSGLLSAGKMQKKSEILIQWLKENDYKIDGQIINAGYDPPWAIPFFRRNEVLIEISES